MIEKNTLNKIFIKSTSSILSLFINLILVFSLTKFLSKYDFGLFNYLTTIGSWFIFFLTAGFSTSFVNIYSQNNIKEILYIYLLINFFLSIVFFVIVNLFIFIKPTYNFLFNEDINILLINLGMFSGLIVFIFEKIGEIYNAESKSQKFDLIKIELRALIIIVILLMEFFNFLDIFKTFIIIISFNLLFILFLLSSYLRDFQIKFILNNFKFNLKKLIKNFMLLYPILAMGAIYQILFRVVLNKDVGIITQGIFGLSILVFSSAISPYTSLSSLLLSLASKNKISSNKKETKNYFLLVNKIILPTAAITITIVLLIYNFFISHFISEHYTISNEALISLFIWCFFSIYYILLFNSIISSNYWKLLITLRSSFLIFLIFILIFIMSNNLKLELDFYYYFLAFGIFIRFFYIIFISYKKFNRTIFIDIEYNIITLIICFVSIFYFLITNNLILPIVIISLISIFWLMIIKNLYKSIN